MESPPGCLAEGVTACSVRWVLFFFSSRRRHTRLTCDWSSDVCSSDLPDSQNRWLNPDLKVYLTTVTIQGTNDWLKPGMSAKVEIFVSRLPDVVYVPVQAVSAAEGKQVCYLASGHKPEQRVVEVGEFNDEFIEIKAG